MSEQHADNAAGVETVAPTIVAGPSAQKPPLWMWIGLAALLIIALLVIFVLPAVVTEYELPLERRLEAPALTANPAAAQEPAISPFEQAQQARERSAAQDVLAQLLERQNALEELEVRAWAEQDYDSALQQAEIGDEYYRTQDFARATTSYNEANSRLQTLLESVPSVLTQVLAEGDAALTAGDAARAQERYSLARVLDIDSEAAGIGLQRARVLDQVNSLFAQAETLEADGDLPAARASLQEIVALDAYNELARSEIERVSAGIRELEFGQVMSEGYALLQRGDPEAAIAAFERAAAMGVNAEQAEAAISQTRNEVANVRINGLRSQITAAETDERWADAVSLYDEVLAIDPNLLFANQGRDYAAKRAQLDSLIEAGINNPERFSDETVFQETVDVYYTGRAIEDAGPRLNQQLDQLLALLEASQIPVDVRFQSDNLTNVTLQRVGELGLFETTTLNLKPGRYVAVGRRIGYREVRQEFVVGFGQTPELVVVECEERVVATSR